jgi:DNA-directed RNA polymerase
MMKTERTWEEQLQRQEELEDVGAERGRERFLKALRKAEEKGRPSNVGGAHSLLLKSLQRVEEGLRYWAKESKKRRGTKPTALKWLTALEPEVIAYLTMKVLLDRVQVQQSVYSVSMAIAQSIEDELVYRELRRVKPALFQYLLSTKFLTQHYKHNQKILKGVTRSNAVEVAHLRMPKKDKVHVGAKCIDLACAVTGLFKVELVTTNPGGGFRGRTKRHQWQILAEPATLEWIARKNEVLEYMTPLAMPMVVPPLPWGPKGQKGGYRFGLKDKYEMVRGASPQQQKVIEHQDMPTVYKAVNFVQSTAWTVNDFIADVVQQIAEQGGGIAGIPVLEPEPMPAKPPDIDTNREARRKWRDLAFATKTRNVLRTNDALKFHRLWREVSLLKDEPTLFFPYNLDFRGRMYPIASHLSPQGDDLSKGLLLFAEGKPLGEKGLEAMCVFGANCMDTDPDTGQKLTRESLLYRMAWAESQKDNILRCAERPLDMAHWWTKADKPFQFLAFCHEYYKAYNNPEGELNYVCGLPIYIDGSCNGLQHFSAMFRDEIGGSAVNLLPSQTPEDVYQRVAEAVIRLCRNVPSADAEYQLARRWLASGLLTRKLCKRPTMTFVYGSKVYGFQDQILEYLSVDERDSWDKTKEHFTIGNTVQMLQAARFLSRIIWEALQETAVKAFEGMEWFQEAAREVCTVGKSGVRWTVPLTNFPVKQEYSVNRKSVVRTILAGKVVKPVIYMPTARPLTKKQQNAVSPNIIHSLDAAALMLTVNMAMQDGVTAFSGIHDSYGTVPADMPLVAVRTRQAFTCLYESVDVPKEFHRMFSQQVPTGTIAAPPSKGSLKLDKVLDSPYFFA